MSPKLLQAIDVAASSTRAALLLAIDEQPVDADLVKRLAAIHGSLIAMKPAAAKPTK